ncbi:CRP-like cAMP-activated global transcriptional regulator [Candidatus Thermoflexus japonica]|uniref:CRP-like cAMP-activated global transcriptional regulator n=1 Tax=Candidatus Thermoflexus japonica TaxID=2035417 RepID=A0A2H5Y5P3_9CHLR|nr:CRP-like cAMP-activated global transcriptional regulator [Candidatus Thermoflexus japonica]
MERFWHLRASPILEGLSERERSRIHAQVRLARYPRGTFIYTPDDPADRLYLLYQGLVRITAVTLEGKEQVLEIVGAGTLFGQFFQPGPRRRRTAAQAMEDVVVGVLTEADLLALISSIPAFGVRLMQEICRAYCMAIDRLEGMIHASAQRRLLVTLLNLASSISEVSPEMEECFVLPACITQEDLANMAGLNRATVSWWINQLRRQGVLGGRGRRLIVYLPRVRKLLEEIP